MSCSTCGNTMGSLGGSQFHCPRCGTYVNAAIGDPKVYVPKLVDRCRAFEADALPKENIGQYYRNTWRQLGIAESIQAPERRPT